MSLRAERTGDGGEQGRRHDGAGRPAEVTGGLARITRYGREVERT